MANIKGIIVEIGGDTSKLQNALKKVNSSTASLSKELKGINSLLKLDPKNTELLSQKQTVLKQNIEQTSKKLEELNKVQEMADATIAEGGEISEKNYRNLQREIINTQNKLNNLKAETSNWTKAGRSIEEFGNKVANISNKVDKLGSTLTTRLTLPIAGIATGLISSAKEFETAFTGVEKTVDGTATQMANLKQGIKDMAEEIPASTTKISAVEEAAGQLGIQTDNILTFTKTMINMGNATNLSADEAATTLARFANVTKMSQSDFDKLGSVIVALGNNFATTEAEITDMGMNLASAGTQVGMSQSQIMALATALSSVGLEAQAGGTAFSKVMVNMQLAVEKGGKDLKNFASVAGMSTKQFQKAFKEDATNAIMQFVDGLSKSGERGKSAIKILDDMGITETRLRDALLRSANASEVMGKAIELGNKAWEENTALTNEADKRYQTLDSRLQTTKNKILNVATNTGDKLTPSFNKLLDKIDGLIDNFDNLNEEEVTNIIKTGALIATIGPAIKIVGTLGKTVGTVTKGVGTFSQAIAVAKNNSIDTSESVNKLAIVAKGLTTPIGLATTAITTLCAAYAAWYIADTTQKASLGGLRDEVKKQKESWESLGESRQNILSSTIPEIETYGKLSDELKQITDENGKVKQGYKDRAQTILGILSKALGTEYTMTGNVIDKYQDLQNEIDKTIAVKRAEAVLNAYQQEYATAMAESSKATETLVGLKQKLAEAAEKMASGNARERKEAEMQYSSIARQIGEQTEIISKYGKTIDDVNNLQKASAEGSAEAIDKAITQIGVSYETLKQKSEQSIEQQIINQGEYIKLLKESWQDAVNSNDVYQSEILNKQLSTQQQELASLADTLAKQTSSVTDLSQDQINAWKILAEQSYSEYSTALSKVGPTTAQKIQEATGIISADTNLTEAAGSKGSQATILFGNNLKLANEAENEISNSARALGKDTTVQDEAGNLANRAQNAIESNNSKTWGEDMVEGLGKGIKQKSEGSWFTGILSGLASTISSFIHFSKPDRGPLREYEKWMPDMIRGLARTLDSSSPKLLNSASNLSQKLEEELINVNMPKVKDFGKLQGSLSRKIANNTSMVNNNNKITLQIYPQHLTEAELDRAFDYLDRKFGQYMP